MCGGLGENSILTCFCFAPAGNNEWYIIVIYVTQVATNWQANWSDPIGERD